MTVTTKKRFGKQQGLLADADKRWPAMAEQAHALSNVGVGLGGTTMTAYTLGNRSDEVTI